MQDHFLQRRLDERNEQGAFRRLGKPIRGVDFCSNDYLGIVYHGLLEQRLQHTHAAHGSGGSRLLTGNSPLLEETEAMIAGFHEAEAALLFNSGYDANLGLLGCIANREDTILYDQLSHASIRDGIRLSLAHSFSFAHNDINDLEKKLQRARGNIFVVTESVFSMDGDMAPLALLVSLCERYGAHLIVDEAHATGVVGDRGEGCVQLLGLAANCFARIYTFGKALGCHGAAIVGSVRLRDYLVNFARSLIYTTALPPAAVHAIRAAYESFPSMVQERASLRSMIRIMRQHASIDSETPIQVVIIPGNEAVMEKALRLAEAGLDVRAIRYPTVPKGSERLRIVLHAFNTEKELEILVKQLA